MVEQYSARHFQQDDHDQQKNVGPWWEIEITYRHYSDYLRKAQIRNEITWLPYLISTENDDTRQRSQENWVGA